MLSPLQVLMINKRMPKGYKLELEENLLKYLDTIKPPAKKSKTNVNLNLITKLINICLIHSKNLLIHRSINFFSFI